MTEDPWKGIEMPEGFDPANNPFLQGMKAGKNPDAKPEERRLEYIAKWAKPFETEHPVLTVPGFSADVKNGIVLVHSKRTSGAEGHLYGIDAQTGEQLFDRYNTGGSSLSSPVGHGNAAFVGAKKGLYSILIEEGHGLRQWDFPTSSEVNSTPVVAGERVYFSTNNGTVHCLDVEAGTEIWKKEGTFYNPVINGDRIYVAGGEEHLYVLDAETGEELWKSDEIDTEVHNVVVLDDQTIVACLETGVINGYDTSGTSPIWQVDSDLVDSIATVGNVLYAGVHTGEMIAVHSAGELESGFGQPKVETVDANPENLNLASNVENGILHVSTGKELVAIDAKTGKQVGRLPIEGCLKPAVYNGTLYVPIGDGTKIQAFEIKERK